MNRGKTFYRGVVTLTLPLVLQNLIVNSLGLIDTFMIGSMGELALAGVTLANVPIFVIMLIIFGIQSGSSVLISQHWGKKNLDVINQVMGIGIYIVGGISALFGVAMLLFSHPFMSLFGNDPEVVAVAASYIRIVAFSYLFDGMTQIYVGAHRCMENPRLGLYILSVAMVCNTFLNWVFIFGNLGAPALGVEGGALATLLARGIGFLVMIAHACFNKRFRISLKALLRPSGELLQKYIQYASPVLLNETLWGLGTSLYTTIMGHMDGSREILAAYAVSGNIERICCVVVFALAGSAAVIVGREIGAGRRDTVYEVGATLNFLSFMTGAVIGVTMIGAIFFVIKPYIYPMFDLSPEAMEIATMMQLVLYLTLGPRAYNCTNIVGVLRGGGDVRTAAMLDLMPLWFVALPLVALFGLVLRLSFVWVAMGMAMENLVKFWGGYRRFRSRLWINDLTVEPDKQHLP